MNPLLLVVAYGLTVVASAVAGGYLPQLISMSHLRMQLLLSFVGGMMLGVATLHLLPHGLIEIQRALAEPADGSDTYANGVTLAMQAMLVGLLFTFLLMRLFHFHQHDDDPHQQLAQDCGHDHNHDQAHHHPVSGRLRLGWIGVLLGLGLHTFMDGVALGAAVQHEQDVLAYTPAGFGVYLAILLHKPLDALSLSSLMTREKCSWRTVMAANVGMGLMCVVGAVAVLLWPPLAPGGWMLGCLLAAAAGVFLCISLSDLLPEIQFHQHDRTQLSTALLLGIGIAWLIEQAHTH